MYNNTSILILAAGRGTRMRSQLPKVLHELAGKPMLQWLVETVQQLEPQQINVVCGYGAEQVHTAFKNFNLHFIDQSEQLGTGHAVQKALPALKNSDRVLILVGDTPLISLTTLQKLIQLPENDIGLLTVNLADPTGFGRIVRDAKKNVIGIVEQKDAAQEQRKIKEISTGIMIVPTGKLQTWVQQLKNHNTQGEYYLTDIYTMAVQEGVTIHTVQPQHEEEIWSVNDKIQLANLERYKQMTTAKQLMEQGVTLRDPARVDVRGELTVGTDVVIDVNVIFEGKVNIGNRCHIGPNVILRNTTLADDVIIKSNCDIDGAIIGKACEIGPFARLRPGTELAEKVKIGNFVETKKAKIANGSKVNHLSYIGDATIGAEVNVGAGVITANYDGANKWPTTIEDGASIGADVVLVAPVKVGKDATIGAGSVISKDAPAGELTLARTQQRTLPGWQRPKKK